MAPWILWGSAVVGFVLKARIAATDDGINWPDEIYQSFEPAHRLVFGHGLVAWEYLEGARTWAVPGFVAVWLWLCKLVHAEDPATYITVVKVVFAALSTGAALGVDRLARSLGAQPLEAAVAAALWNLCGLSLYFAPRAMSENLAAVLVVWGLAFLLRPDGRRRERIIGASLLGLATIARLQVGVICFVVALISFWSRDQRKWVPREGLEVLITLTAWALVLGTWDALAWHQLPTAKAGGFFHSAVVYYRFNIVENRGAGWGTAPWTYFFEVLFRAMPWVSGALGVGLLLSIRRAWPVVAAVVVFLLLHLFVSHKELRFILPVLPLLCALVAVGMASWSERNKVLALGVVGAALALSTLTHRALTMGDVGSYPERPQSSAWDDFGPVNRLMLAASRQSDLCGLRIDAAHLAWTGGITYLHRNAPLYMPGTSPQPGYFNYAIARPGSGLPVVASEGPWELVRLGPSCNPDPGYTWRLP